ncbi:MAG: hypothetical protein ACI8TQ_000622, partial [Planctomycetota bacterium]
SAQRPKDAIGFETGSIIVTPGTLPNPNCDNLGKLTPPAA